MAFEGECLIRRAGITPEGRVQLDLQAADKNPDGSPLFDWNWFLGRAELTQQILAVALAAITSNKRVAVQLDDPGASWSDVDRFLLVK